MTAVKNRRNKVKLCKEDKIIDIMSCIKDPLGYFYAYTMSKSLIKRSVKEGGQ